MGIKTFNIYTTREIFVTDIQTWRMFNLKFMLYALNVICTFLLCLD
jgi:hypothetical protein